jgi:hypothetical protein
MRNRNDASGLLGQAHLKFEPDGNVIECRFQPFVHVQSLDLTPLEHVPKKLDDFFDKNML